MYRSLLWQLLAKIPQVQSILDSYTALTNAATGDTMSWDLPRLEELFRRAVLGLDDQSVMLFIDALDECHESQVRDMVEYFTELGERALSRNTPLYVLFSSRHYPYITMERGMEMILEGQEGHTQDLCDYLDSKLAVIKHKQIQEVKEEILTKASGIFLWVALVADILKKTFDQGRMGAVRKRLREIPPKLNDLFKDILTRDNEHMEDLYLCLQWVLYAKRPLNQEELYFAIQSRDDLKLDVSESTEDTGSIQKFILNSSKGLVEVTKPNGGIV
jgi:cell division protein ZapA (FtsZ GTPase activity inhibitor)